MLSSKRGSFTWFFKLFLATNFTLYKEMGEIQASRLGRGMMRKGLEVFLQSIDRVCIWYESADGIF